MADLVTLEEAKQFLRVDFNDDDATIEILIAAASDAVRDVVAEWDGEGDSPEFVPDRIKLAVLTRVSIAYDDRERVESARGELAMLTPLRTLET